MPKQTPRIINIICYRLPYELSSQLYQEFDFRFKEAQYLIEHFSYYKTLKRDIRAVEMILALSIYHKRVISNLDAALKFRQIVISKSQAKSVTIGKYDFNSDERRHILSILLDFRKIQQRFGLYDVFEYIETKDLLKKIKIFKSGFGKNKKQDGWDYPTDNFPI